MWPSRSVHFPLNLRVFGANPLFWFLVPPVFFPADPDSLIPAPPSVSFDDDSYGMMLRWYQVEYLNFNVEPIGV
jgi:hypothetical protein